MAIRLREDGTLVCAALRPEMPSDLYIDDNLHHFLTSAKLICTDERHKEHAEWWWTHEIPEGVVVKKYYLESPYMNRQNEDGFLHALDSVAKAMKCK